MKFVFADGSYMYVPDRFSKAYENEAATGATATTSNMDDTDIIPPCGADVKEDDDGM